MNLPENVTRIAPSKAKSVGEKTALAVLQDRFGGVAQLVARRNDQLFRANLSKMTELSSCYAGDRERALARLEKIPSRELLEEQHEALRAALYEPASEREARAILGLMLEGIPAAASGATQSYGDALAFAVIHADDDRDPETYPRWRGFSAAVLFAATRRIWTTSTFTPSIAEVIKTAREVRADYYAALARTNRLLELRANARDVIADMRRVMCPDDLHDEDEPF